MITKEDLSDVVLRNVFIQLILIREDNNIAVELTLKSLQKYIIHALFSFTNNT